MAYHTYSNSDVEVRRITSIYERNGYADREAYLSDLSDQYGVPYRQVLTLSALLGETEDFDGLVSHLSELAFLGDY